MAEYRTISWIQTLHLNTLTVQFVRNVSPPRWLNVTSVSTWVMDHFTMTFLAKTLNMVARYFTKTF